MANHGPPPKVSPQRGNPIMPVPVGAYTGGAGSPLNPLDRFGRSCLMLRVGNRAQARWRHCMLEPMARALPLPAVAVRTNFVRMPRLEYAAEINISGDRKSTR